MLENTLYFGTFTPTTVTFTDAVMDWLSLFSTDNLNRRWSQFIGSIFFVMIHKRLKHIKVPKENGGEEVSCLHHPHSKKHATSRIQSSGFK